MNSVQSRKIEPERILAVMVDGVSLSVLDVGLLTLAQVGVLKEALSDACHVLTPSHFKSGEVKDAANTEVHRECIPHLPVLLHTILRSQIISFR